VPIKAVPTVEAIQRTTVAVAILAALGCLIEASPRMAFSCMVGAGLMVANLTVLSWIVRTMFALARQAGGATMLGLIAAPLKMLLLVGVTFVIIESGRLNVAGFIVGTLTQFAAIFIEIGRASIGHRLSAPSY
jgi:ATP synthase I subunit